MIDKALIAAVGVLLLALGIVGYIAHDRGKDLAVAQARIEAYKSAEAVYVTTQATNLATIETLHKTNKDNDDAAKASKRLADQALQRQIETAKQLRVAEADAAKARAQAYASDAKLRAWGDVLLPDSVAGRLRSGAGVHAGGGNENGDGLSRPLHIPGPQAL